MSEFFDNLLKEMDPGTAYLILFVSAFVENAFPPIPGDTVTVIGAYLAASGRLGIWGVYLSTTFGSVIGFFTMYLIGYFSGRSFLKTKFRKRIFSEEQIQKVEQWFARWGYWVLTANRFLAGTRSVVSFFAGTFQLSWYKVIILSTISAAVWNGLLIYGGFLVGVNWPMIMSIVDQYNRVILLLTIVIIGYVIFRRRKKKNIRKNQDFKEETRDISSK